MGYEKFLKPLIAQVGTYTVNKKVYFTPNELARDLSEHLKKPKEELVLDTIEFCKGMIELGYFWVNLSNYNNTMENTGVMVKRPRSFQAVMERYLRECPLAQ